MLNQIVVAGLGLVTTIVAAVFTAVIIPRINARLAAKTHSQLLLTAMDELSQGATLSINQLNQTVVDQLKKDGKFDLDAQKQVLDTAVKQIQSNLTTQTVDFLTKNGTDITALIVSYVESCIASTKSAVTKPVYLSV